MKARLFEDGHDPVSLRRIGLGELGRGEKWLQTQLFQNPDLIPIEAVDPGAGEVVSICRELALTKGGGPVFLDLFAATARGRLVLVECKLWRNPQSRREVVGQILEYASLVRRWTYADLTARLKAQLGWGGSNPLFDHVRQRVPSVDEITFVDAVHRSLVAGDFDLVIAGDGIRSDLQAIANHINGYGGATARLALVEFQVWADETGRTLLIPAVPFRTEVVQHRLVVSHDGRPLSLAPLGDVAEENGAADDPTKAKEREHNRAFWQSFIERAHFDHPDQPPARHGGNNWVRLALPEPAGWMTVFRSKERAGVFVGLSDTVGEQAFEALRAEAASLDEEVGFKLQFDVDDRQPFKGTIGVYRPTGSDSAISEETLLDWLQLVTNRIINALRPRLAGFSAFVS